jgi:hypothetical protein
VTETPKSAEQHQEARKLNLQIAQRQHDVLQEHIRSMNEAAVTSANHALRTVLLVNGGAAVSMLAFIGGLVSNGKVLVGAQLASVAAPLIWFALGVALAGLATAFAYFTNSSAASAANSMQRLWEYPWLQPTTASRRWVKSYYTCLVITVLSGFGSLFLFGVGMYKVWKAILELGVSS